MTTHALIAHLRRWAATAWKPSQEPMPFERGHHCARKELLAELDRIEAQQRQEAA